MRNVLILFRQLRFVDFIRIGFLEFIRKSLNLDISIAYGQNGEDRVILSILDTSKPGFYVDVGSNKPIHFSNTFALYCRGWVGITIDANDKLVAQHKIKRPNDIAICQAVSDEEMNADYVEYELDEMSTINPNRKVELDNMGLTPSITRNMLTATLDSILAKNMHKDTSIDLLSIDVEGHDYHVLLSINLTVTRPKLIVIEMHNFDFVNSHLNDIYCYMVSNKYRLVAFVKWNGYFKDYQKNG